MFPAEVLCQDSLEPRTLLGSSLVQAKHVLVCGSREKIWSPLGHCPHLLQLFLKMTYKRALLSCCSKVLPSEDSGSLQWLQLGHFWLCSLQRRVEVCQESTVKSQKPSVWPDPHETSAALEELTPIRLPGQPPPRYSFSTENMVLSQSVNSRWDRLCCFHWYTYI